MSAKGDGRVYMERWPSDRRRFCVCSGLLQPLVARKISDKNVRRILSEAQREISECACLCLGKWIGCCCWTSQPHNIGAASWLSSQVLRYHCIEFFQPRAVLFNVYCDAHLCAPVVVVCVSAVLPRPWSLWLTVRSLGMQIGLRCVWGLRERWLVWQRLGCLPEAVRDRQGDLCHSPSCVYGKRTF